MKKIIFAALLSLTAILIIASCSSEVTKAKYQTEINEMVTKYIDNANVAYSTPTGNILFEKVVKAYTTKSDEGSRQVIVKQTKVEPKKVTYNFTTSTDSGFTTDTCTVTWGMDADYEAFDACFVGCRVSGLTVANYKDIESTVNNIMTDSKSRTAFVKALNVEIEDADKVKAIKKSAAIFAELSTSSDLIVKSLNAEKKRDSKKLEACTAVLSACYKYFSGVAEEDSSVTKANLLAFELLESYIDLYSEDYVKLITDSSHKIHSDLAQGLLSRAKIFYEITGVDVTDYITKIFIN